MIDSLTTHLIRENNIIFIYVANIIDFFFKYSLYKIFLI